MWAMSDALFDESLPAARCVAERRRQVRGSERQCIERAILSCLLASVTCSAKRGLSASFTCGPPSAIRTKERKKKDETA